MYTYAIGVFFFIGIWCVLFVLIPKSRKPILWSSFAWGHAGPISEYWHLKDYWNPTYILKIQVGNWIFGIEDYLLAFAFGGLCAGIFDLLVRKSGAKELASFHTSRYAKLLLLGVSCLFAMGALKTFFNVNSLYSITIAFLVGGVLMLYCRREWIFAAIQTAVIIGIFMWISYWGFYLMLFPSVIEQWWYSDALSGILLAGVPIEEVMWAGTTALFVGPALRYCLD